MPSTWRVTPPIRRNCSRTPAAAASIAAPTPAPPGARSATRPSTVCCPAQATSGFRSEPRTMFTWRSAVRPAVWWVCSARAMAEPPGARSTCRAPSRPGTWFSACTPARRPVSICRLRPTAATAISSMSAAIGSPIRRRASQTGLRTALAECARRSRLYRPVVSHRRPPTPGSSRPRSPTPARRRQRPARRFARPGHRRNGELIETDDGGIYRRTRRTAMAVTGSR